MSRPLALFLLPLALITDLAVAAEGRSRPLNWNAIGMFMVFVLFTLGVHALGRVAHPLGQ